MTDDLAFLINFMIDKNGAVFIVYATSLATSWCLIRWNPTIREVSSQGVQNRSVPIDGLRGMLGIGVFCHHIAITWFYLHTRVWELPESHLLIHLGQTSVALFFMITAFLFWGRVLDRRGNIIWSQFFVSRLYRLYPIYIVAISIMFFLTTYLPRLAGTPTDGPIWRPVIKWLLFAVWGAPNFNGFDDTAQLMAGVVWSLRYEWLFYLALPLLAWATNGRWRAVGIGIVTLALIVYAPHLLPTFRTNPMILQLFLGGIAAAYVARNPTLVRLAKTPAATLVAISSLLMVGWYLDTAYSFAATIGLGIFFSIVACGNDLGGFLSGQALRWLGDITYPIYLLHGLLLVVVFRGVLTVDQSQNAAWFFALVPIITISLIIVSSASFVLIERPAILAGRRHYDALKRLGRRVAG